jgi:hypothetical protein
MANRYRNAQFDLTTTDATDVYTVPSESRAIIQNIHMANIGAGNVVVQAHIYDDSATKQFTFAKHTINSNEFTSCIRWHYYIRRKRCIKSTSSKCR